MRTMIIATACIGALMGSAFAQTAQMQGGAQTGPTSPTVHTGDQKGMGLDSSGAGKEIGTTGLSNDRISSPAPRIKRPTPEDEGLRDNGMKR